jgi:hypothetical protein
MNMKNMPGFSAEASLPSEAYPYIHREVLRDFDNWSRILPARGFVGDAICEALLRGCFDDVLGACSVYGSLCTLGGPFE